MLKNKIRIGVLGTAGIAKRSVIPALLELNNIYEVIGIASREIGKSTNVSKDFGIRGYGSYDAILNKDLIDAVYIPLPNALHYHWIANALAKGIHVLVEKSLACSLKEVVELTNLAREKQLVVVENFQFRFHSQLAFIKNLLEEGKIGDLRCLRSSFGFPPFADPQNIRYSKELGGGALLDAGAYPVKLTQLFLGNNIEVGSSTLSYDEKKSVDIWGGAFLKQSKGNLFAEIAFGFDNYYQCSLELWGSKGKLSTNRIFTAPLGYQPEVLLETQKGNETFKLEPDHHFKNMLIYFSELVDGTGDREDEYQQNINQARLLGELFTKSTHVE